MQRDGRPMQQDGRLMQRDVNAGGVKKKLDFNSGSAHRSPRPPPWLMKQFGPATVGPCLVQPWWSISINRPPLADAARLRHLD